MTETLGTLLLLVPVFAATALATVLALAALWPAIERATKGWHPERRARVAALAASATVWLPAAVVLGCLLPGLVELLGGAGDHCPLHRDHPHLCLAHPTASLTPASAGLALVAFALLAWAFVARARPLLRASAPLARLAALARPTGERVLRVDADRPLALTLGVLRPRVLLSRGLCEALAPEQLEAVIAHERAHVARRDPLLRAAAALLSFALPARLRRRILEALELASEQACDERAAEAIGGDRLLVAEALLAGERLAAAHGSPRLAPSAGLGGSTVPARVRSLLAPPSPPPRHARSRVALGLIAAAAGFVLLAEPLHHAVEHLLRAVLHTH